MQRLQYLSKFVERFFLILLLFVYKIFINEGTASQSHSLIIQKLPCRSRHFVF
nr:MAG TPA: hypothetical protein [Caudoviricetes sp.]